MLGSPFNRKQREKKKRVDSQLGILTPVDHLVVPRGWHVGTPWKQEKYRY